MGICQVSCHLSVIKNTDELPQKVVIHLEKAAFRPIFFESGHQFGKIVFLLIIV
jgi:hypothetical protein